MSLLSKQMPNASESDIGDADAIVELNEAFSVQKNAFFADRNPSLQTRRARIQAVMDMVVSHRDAIGEALIQDFGAHPKPASDLIEVLGVCGRGQFAIDNLEHWMEPIHRPADPGLVGNSEVYIQSQPKGVTGNIVPWNFPFDIALGPMIDMFAAGNRVMIKPSEYTPACAELLQKMVAESFPSDLAYVAVGGLDLARSFSSLAFDHLLYTGSTNVGRQVMVAAAQNLTPVTLELGGKCPSVMAPGSVSAENVSSVVGVKIIKNGQMCISVDHVYVPRADLDTFVSLARAFMDEAAPDYARSDECTGIVSDSHLDRLTDMLTEARGRAEVVVLEQDDSIDRVTRRMPMHLVIDPPRDLKMMKEEIFGPIMPVIPYDDLDGAISHINDGEHPLGVYVFSDDQVTVDHVINTTISGGACVNTCAIQGGLPSLGFGGIGASGMGRHHGEDGFREFSNQRGVVVLGEDSNVDLFYSPYSKAAALADDALGAT